MILKWERLKSLYDTVYTEGDEKMYTHFKQRKNYVFITKLNSHKQKFMSTNHLRLSKLQLLQQLLKMPTMGGGTLQSTLNYCFEQRLRKGPLEIQLMAPCEDLPHINMDGHCE